MIPCPSCNVRSLSLTAYLQAQALLRAGTWLVSADEKTSIQAREGEMPPRPVRPGKPALYEARYYRRGARHLFAGLSVADGKVYGTCRERKRFVDFQTFVQQVILPEALRRGVHTVIFILDNGTTHAPKQLENWLQTQAGVCDLRLRFQVQWLPPRASWLDQIAHLVQHFPAQMFAAQPLRLDSGSGRCHWRVHRFLQPAGQAH